MMHKKQQNRPAFTMIEIIFVIIVLGILTSMAISRIDRDTQQEAADDILSQIRYTQHLAIMDNKHLFNKPKWQRRYWQIMFSTCNGGGLLYRIGSDDNMDSTSTFEESEAATDPQNGKPLYATNATCDNNDINKNVLLGEKYGVTTITGSGDCVNRQQIGFDHLGFDHLGRPHVGFSASTAPDYSSYMQNRCTFVFTIDGGDDFNISIEPETGHAFIGGNINS